MAANVPVIKYDVVEKIGEISVNSRGWPREINLISWNGYPAKYDIRDWSPDHDRMAKGLTFTAEELGNLREILNKLDLPTEELPE